MKNIGEFAPSSIKATKASITDIINYYMNLKNYMYTPVENAFKNADSSFADFEGAGTKKVKVASGTIIADKNATAKVVQELKVNVKFYNFPTLDQSQLADKDFKGKFFVDNDSESATKVVCTTAAA